MAIWYSFSGGDKSMFAVLTVIFWLAFCLWSFLSRKNPTETPQPKTSASLRVELQNKRDEIASTIYKHLRPLGSPPLVVVEDPHNGRSYSVIIAEEDDAADTLYMPGCPGHLAAQVDVFVNSVDVLTLRYSSSDSQSKFEHREATVENVYEVMKLIRDRVRNYKPRRQIETDSEYTPRSA